VVAILTATHMALKTLQKDEEEKRLREEALIRRQEEARRRQEEEAGRKELEVQAQNWMKSRNLRTFLQACEGAMAERLGSLPLDGAEAEWLRWAYSHADRLDPLKNGYIESIAPKMSKAGSEGDGKD